ncbi:hypothetical protein ES703_104512 [subsurface metagenome]
MIGAIAEGQLHLPFEPIGVFQVGPLGHTQVDVDIMGVHVREELDWLFKPNLKEPDHGHGYQAQKGHGQDRQAVIECTIKQATVGLEHRTPHSDGCFTGLLDLLCASPDLGKAVAWRKSQKDGC